MPIKKFEIRENGPIKYVKAENLPAVIIIAGPNGVGKSTLLEALKRRSGNISIDGTGKFLYIPPHRTPVVFSLHRSLPSIGPRTRCIDILTQDSFSISAPGISLPYYLTSGTQRSRSTPDFAPYFEAKYKLAQFQQEFGHRLIEVFDKFGGKIPEGVMPRDIYRPFRELVKTLLPGISFDHIALEGEVYRVYFVNRTGVLVEFDQLSSGERDIIAMLFPFIEKEIENELAKAKGEEMPHEDLVILIDTPESYLHPTLQRNLLDYIRNSVKEAEIRGEKLQFFIATHSTTIVNEAKPEELYVMLFPDQSPSENQIVRIATDKEKMELIREVLGDIGLAALATGKPLLLLEGPNDVEILKLLKPDIEEKFALLPLRGKGKILKFTEVFKSLIGELRSRGFKIFAILDKNSGAEETKEDYCFTWSRACIENFLLIDPEAIFEALKVMIGETEMKSKGVESKEAVADLIDEIVNDSEIVHEEVKKRIEQQLWFRIGDKWETLDELEKMAQEIFETKMDRIRKRYKELSNRIKQIVTDKKRLLIELNGKIILGRVASKFSVDKEMLARHMADKLMTLGRIPQEITDLISRIEKSC